MGMRVVSPLAQESGDLLGDVNASRVLLRAPAHREHRFQRIVNTDSAAS
jgi:hypothetical protein